MLNSFADFLMTVLLKSKDHFDSKCAFYLYLCTFCHYYVSNLFQISRANIVFVPAKVDRLSQRLGPYTLFGVGKYRSKITKLFLHETLYSALASGC